MANYTIIPITDNFYGIKKIESSLDTLICFIMPRDKVKDFVKCEESQKSGIYVLYDLTHKKLYIGESGSKSKNRLDNHLKNKGWWTDALVFTTKTDDFTPTHAKILESRLIGRAIELELDLDNSAGSNEPIVKDKYSEDCKEWEKQIVELTKLLNLKLFIRQEENTDNINNNNKKRTFDYPTKYRIYGKTYVYSVAYEMLVNQCERIIDIKGSDVFNEAVNKISGILFNKNNSSDTKYELSNKTIINKHGSAKEHFESTEKIAKMFPDFKLELIYEND